MNKELLFSVTSDDCRFDYYRASGKGGQKRNKTNSAVRCTHIASGAVGNSSESRSQHENKRTAFLRMSQTKEFLAWHKLECAKQMGKLKDVENVVDKEMEKIKIEVRQDGKWIEQNESD